MIANVGGRYNLGAAKLKNWIAAEPAGRNGTIYISAIFTWDLPEAVKVANFYRGSYKVEIGGPGPSLMPDWVFEQTGIRPHVGLDPRFEHQPGCYDYTFTSRGCPNRCENCAVWRLEPEQVEYEDYSVASVIGDNNILATSWAHQERVVERHAPLSSGDIQSGFDCELFEERHYQLYSRLHLKRWRFAFDRAEQEPDLVRCIAMVRKLSGSNNRMNIMVYVLVNHGETPEEAARRAHVVKDAGAMPFIMVYRPLNQLTRARWISPEWTRRQLADFAGGINNSKFWKRR